MFAVSYAAVLLAVNNTALPSGRTCGQRCVNSPLCISVNGVGAPPAEGIRDRPPPIVRAAMMLPSSPQPPPRKLGAIHKAIADPPSTEIFCNFPDAEKPTHCPSGEKKGPYAPCVPASSIALG